MMDLSRRGLLRGLGALIAAPAIVKVGSLMPVKMPVMFDPIYSFSPGLAAMQDLEIINARIKRMFFDDMWRMMHVGAT